MPDLTLHINPQFSLTLSAVGEERTPLIIIDDFALDTATVIDQCKQSMRFDIDRTSAYPGVRSVLDRGYVIPTVNAILALLYKTYGIPTTLKPKPQSAFFSFVTLNPQDLELLQRLPHFDSNQPCYFAITHYLGAGSHGGTGLFRHRPTGFERISEDRLDRYIRAGQEYLEKYGEPERKYFTTSDGHYELYEVIDYRPNRLVIYPGALLHSGLIEQATDIGTDAEFGRLTANIFVDFQ